MVINLYCESIIMLFFLPYLLLFGFCQAQKSESAAYKRTAVPAILSEQFTKDDLSSWRDSWLEASDANYAGSWMLKALPKPSLKNEFGLVTTKPATSHILYNNFERTVKIPSETIPIVLSFQVRPMKEWTCGHSFVKVLSTPYEGNTEPEYSILFGPKKCGLIDRVEFIIHPPDVPYIYVLRNPPVTDMNTSMTSVYTAILYNGSYEIRVNGEIKAKGDIQKDFDRTPLSPKARKLYNTDTITPPYALIPHKLSAVSLNVWNQNKDVYVNNIFVSLNVKDAEDFVNQTYVVKHLLESQNKTEGTPIYELLFILLKDSMEKLFELLRYVKVHYMYIWSEPLYDKFQHWSSNHPSMVQYLPTVIFGSLIVLCLGTAMLR
ncbi:calreticulin/calnexin [Schizosaccharomyces japonicus yFS275]|uniref:Calreticulin/calnexin n=1 Tax=Schizosaccharomyces japonicus (strain yFS275 / FY16936) TaxID=402676 RepID=B6JYG4_SCHJY|nr:calreticulin/calnexin [Schizosaccharomyces japonicus yFS275]EEB06582.1 calreticulin/calnexin [Schizosaccharomyces japonicus yFS275]